jgi:hypothetical protein
MWFPAALRASQSFQRSVCTNWEISWTHALAMCLRALGMLKENGAGLMPVLVHMCVWALCVCVGGTGVQVGTQVCAARASLCCTRRPAVLRRCGAGRGVCEMIDAHEYQGDALPTIADVYPPSKPIFSFYPRSADRSRTFPRGKELDYFDKTYSDGCVAAASRVRTYAYTYTFACT